jgi:hypothetical protein
VNALDPEGFNHVQVNWALLSQIVQQRRVFAHIVQASARGAASL